tara:strand:+ start:10101 stop:10568 length:468 start_codon:yes stop_codon:yes gene_type:complete
MAQTAMMNCLKIIQLKDNISVAVQKQVSFKSMQEKFTVLHTYTSTVQNFKKKCFLCFKNNVQANTSNFGLKFYNIALPCSNLTTCGIQSIMAPQLFLFIEHEKRKGDNSVPMNEQDIPLQLLEKQALAFVNTQNQQTDISFDSIIQTAFQVSDSN